MDKVVVGTSVPPAEAARPIRVLHLRDSPWVDGPGRTILESASHVDPSRCEYHIGAFVSEGMQGTHPLVEAAQRRGLRVHPICDHGGLSRELVGRIIELIDKHDIQILHTHEFRSDLLGLLCRRHRRVILMTTAHGWIANDVRGQIFKAANKVLLRWFDKTILVSEAMRGLIPRWWLSEGSTQVLHNALVLESYASALGSSRRAYAADGRINVLNVGRLSPEKGQLLLVEAFARLLQRQPNLYLQFAGVGPLESRLKEKVDALGIANRVGFLGYVRDMLPVYGQADLVVQSSVTEGLPNVILEAAYLRIPIVATDVGGTAEVIEHERSGWLIAPRSVVALEQGIERFLKDPKQLAAMAERAHERISTMFSFQARTENLMRIYESELEKHG